MVKYKSYQNSLKEQVSSSYDLSMKTNFIYIYAKLTLNALCNKSSIAMPLARLALLRPALLISILVLNAHIVKAQDSANESIHKQTQLMPPGLTLDAKQKKQSATLFSQYKEAQTNTDKQPKLACSIYSQLSENKEFPLKELSTLKALEVCSKLDSSPKTLNALKADNLKNLDSVQMPWLKPLLLKKVLFISQSKNDYKKIIEYTDQLIELNKNFKTSITDDIFKNAISASKKLNNLKKQTEYEKALYKQSPSKLPAPELSDYFAVAKDYQKKRSFKKSLYFFNNLQTHPKSSVEQKYQALKGKFSLARLQRRDLKKNYIKSSDDLVAFVKTHYEKNKNKTWAKRFHNASEERARIYWTYGNVKKAKSILFDLEKKLKNKFTLQKVYWLLAKIDEESKRFKESVAWLEKSRQEKIYTGEIFTKSQWQLAWNYYKMNNFKKAEEVFQNLVAKEKSLNYKFKFMYWYARSLKKNNKNSQAKSVLQNLISQDYIGYYGALGHRELGIKFSNINSNIKTDLASETNYLSLFKSEYYYAHFLWLIEVGEKDLALSMIKYLSKDINENNDETFMVLLKAYAKTGNYLSLFIKLGKLPTEKGIALIKKNPNLIFPRPYSDFAEKYAKEYNIPLELGYAIMRQESAFNPLAKSPAHAMGLMQILPGIAKELSKRLKLTYNGYSDLYNPERNIQLGNYLLKTLFKRYDRQFILSVASYNASFKAVQEWVKSRYQGDPTVFIEDIPYNETQLYIKLVLRNFISYQRIINQKEDIEFPEWCLTNLQAFKN